MAKNNGTIAQQENSMTDNDVLTASKGGPSPSLRDKIGEHAGNLREQATAKAQDYAAQGKDKATELLDGLVELVDGAVTALDRNFGDNDIGAGASDYARRAAGALSGFNQTLREKEVGELLDDARAAIRNNPAIAIGAAAAIGFVLARLIKAGGEEDQVRPAPSAADIAVNG